MEVLPNNSGTDPSFAAGATPPIPYLEAITQSLDSFEAALVASTEGSRGDGPDLFTQSNNLAIELSSLIQAVPEAERAPALLALTGRLHALLPPRDEQQPGSTYDFDSAIGTVVSSYAYLLDPETVPLASLLQLTRISVFCDLGSELPQLAQAVYKRDHNELFGDGAPDFVRDKRFTSTLLYEFLKPHASAKLRPTPQELMLSGREVARATELHLMAYGFSGSEAATITSLWGTVVEGDTGYTDHRYGALLDNIDTFNSIERQERGLGLRLFRERGIVHFGRYPDELLLQQFEPLPEGVRPDFMLLAHDDHNAAFTSTVWTLVNSLGLEDLKGLRIAEVDSPEELVRLAGVLAEQFGPALNLIIGGHGQENSTVFGPSYVGRERALTTLHIDQVEGELAGLVQFVLPDGSIILVSCSTGAEGAIAEPVADTLGRPVQAPVFPSNISDAHRDETGRIIAEFHEGAGRTVLPASLKEASSAMK